MARAMWKGSLELGRTRIPVKLHAVVEERGVHFRLLHAKDKVPVRQRMVDPSTGEEVEHGEVRRGLELDEGVFVVLDDDELARLDPKPSRSIEITRFVPADAIDLAWYSRPYFLSPDGCEDDYFALAQALHASGRRGIARWVMRNQQYFGALASHGEHLALIALHASNQVVAADQLEAPSGSTISASERKLAEQLIAALDAPFDPKELRDDYRERVEKLIRAKRSGRSFKVKEAAPPRARGDLAEVLKKSLRAAKGSRRAA
jgi:DNA end-binding protein Ku